MVHSFLRNYLVELLLVVFGLVFSFWLMFHTFSYNDGTMHIAVKAWSDFASHIPLIRSFSLGNNLPPEYPLFPGEPIRYHFLFYFFVGMFEKMGIRIDFALNILSALSFAALMCIIYLLAKILFQSKIVAVLSVLFFLFNGSLSFLEFFKDHPLSFHTIQDITTITAFPSFAPYGKGIVSAFWNLNIYTNQRHLAAAYALSLILVFLLLRTSSFKRSSSLKMGLVIGFVLGASFFFHMAVFVMTAIAIGMIFLLFPKLRLGSFTILLVAGLIALPQYNTIHAASSAFSLSFRPGYLIAPNLTVTNVLGYWFANLGLHMVLIPFGFLLAPKNAKKILLSVLPLFILGNLYQFSVEIAANHKFFNYFMLFGVMFSAYFLVYIWRKSIKFRPFVIVFSILLVLSGIIDFFPVYNDGKIALADYPKNPDVKWIIQNTPKDAVFLNSTYLYNPASLAGRKIFLGWPYFAWSQGYDTNKRDALRKELFDSNNKLFFCENVKKYKLDYIVINEKAQDLDFVNKSFFDNTFPKIYQGNSLTMYAARQKCSG